MNEFDALYELIKSILMLVLVAAILGVGVGAIAGVFMTGFNYMGSFF